MLIMDSRRFGVVYENTRLESVPSAMDMDTMG